MADHPLLIAVTDIDQLHSDVQTWATAIFDGGVDVIQIREPELKASEIAHLAKRILAVAPGADRVQLNGHPTLAVELGCGMHLPERAPVPALLRSPASRSVHSVESTRDSRTFDFVIAGHIFPTPSHAGKPGRGLDWLGGIVQASHVPVVAIGGIDASNTPSCLSAGASGIAVIRALTDAPDPYQAAAELRSMLNDVRNASPDRRH